MRAWPRQTLRPPLSQLGAKVMNVHWKRSEPNSTLGSTVHPLSLTKFKRVARRVGPAAFEIFKAPVFNWSSFLGLAVAVLTTALLIQTQALPRVIQEVNDWITWGQAVAWVGIGWVALSTFLAPFKVIRDDRKQGRFQSHHFIYHEPLLVATERFEAGDGDTSQREIFFKDAEPNAFVYYSCELTPRLDKRILVTVGGGPPSELRKLQEPGTINWGNDYAGTRLPENRSATLCVRMLPGTIPVVCRVYCHSFFIGKDDKYIL